MKRTKTIWKSVAILAVVALVSISALKGCGSESYNVAEPVIDPSAPITIEGGLAYTYSTTVTLALHADDTDGVAAYFVSESGTAPGAADAGWVAVAGSPATYDGTVNYTFASTPSNGADVTVYVWFKDSLGNISATESDTIKYFVQTGGGCGT